MIRVYWICLVVIGWFVHASILFICLVYCYVCEWVRECVWMLFVYVMYERGALRISLN